MKSFSPAGAATKAYYGLGARTFGNPDGALRGGGAYARGGANINGPTQGGGGAAAGGSVVFKIAATAANSSGPYLLPQPTALIDGVTTNPPAGPANLGSFNPTPVLVKAQPLVVLGAVGIGPTWYYTVCLSAVVIPAYFTNMTFTTVGGPVVVLTSASADFNTRFTAAGFSIWSWPMPNTGVPPDFFATNSNITITWP